MKRIRVVSIGAAVLIVGFAIFLATRDTAGVPTNVEPGDSVSFSVEPFGSDTSLTSEKLRGKVIYVNFWNSWCDPCKEEEPTLQAFFDAHRDDTDFRMVAIVHRDTRGKVQSWMSAHPEAQFDIAWDPDERAADAFGVTGQPESYMIDAQGRVVALQKSVMTPAGLEAMLARARSLSAGDDAR